MNNRCARIPLLILAMMVILINIPSIINAQFEQKLSANISGGYFNTIGKYSWDADWGPEPTLMPNFGGGFSVSAGLQYNFSRHFSVEFHFSWMFSPYWYWDASPDGEESFNYLYYEIETELGSGIVETSGENYMDMNNLQIGISPRYYILPGKKLNPFVFAGITFDNLDVWFENLEYQAYEELGRLDEYEESYDLENWFDYYYGFGITAGAGIEYVISDKLGLFFKACYDFVPLKEESFVYETKYADFHAINLHLGVRISFLKSKDL
jgi:hypothetical protein